MRIQRFLRKVYMRKILILFTAGTIAMAMGCGKKYRASCDDSARSLKILHEKSVRVVCGTYCSLTTGSVWGSGPYTTDSSVCRAALHAGVMHDVTGGIVTVTMKPGQSKYEGSDRNGIRSLAWGQFDSSFEVTK